jgi:DNA-binding transcriptional MerR regulator
LDNPLDRLLVSIANRRPDRRWTVQDIAAELGVSVKTIRRLEKAGEMPPRWRHIRTFKYEDADIQPWLADQKRQRGSR